MDKYDRALSVGLVGLALYFVLESMRSTHWMGLAGILFFDLVFIYMIITRPISVKILSSIRIKSIPQKT